MIFRSDARQHQQFRCRQSARRDNNLSVCVHSVVAGLVAVLYADGAAFFDDDPRCLCVETDRHVGVALEWLQKRVGRGASAPGPAARLAGFGRTTLYAALSKGDLPSIRIGTRHLIRVEAIRDWLARNETGPKG